MPTTKRYDFNELLSALQKDIRRGKIYPAMFWAVELETLSSNEFGNNDEALWSRLRVIASEDISMANPALPVIIDVLEEQCRDFKDRGDKSYRLFLAHAILALCKSSKSRIANNLVILVYGERKSMKTKPPIPDYALDMHTVGGAKKGRRKGTKKGMEHFLKEGAKLRNETQKFEDKYKKKAEEILLKHGEP